jgi:membrane-anchored mycosin MYCP
MRSLVRGCVLLAVLLLAALSGAVPAVAKVPPYDVPPAGCMKVTPGGELATAPWAQARLNFRSLWSITEGRSIDTGKPVVVGVIDTGLDPRQPQMTHINRTGTFDAVTAVNDHNRVDCQGHGTEVTSLIAAQPSDTSAFYGVAPQVKIVPIKYTNTGGSDVADPIIRAFKYAIDQHVDIINFSSGAPNQLGPAFVAQLKRAQQENILVVVAGGNDKADSGNATVYPAAYSTQFPNVIAVSAIDESGSTGNFSTSGNYIDVAAPGVNVVTATRYSGFVNANGTSFAAPFVTGTAALMLAAHPGMSPESIKDRIEATADPPPGAVPDKLYGYGILNPVLAVTGTQNDTVSLAPPSRGAALAAPRDQKPADRSLAHHALAIAVILLGLAALVITGAATLRGNRPTGRRTPRQPAPR